jgi:hypothetical protein
MYERRGEQGLAGPSVPEVTAAAVRFGIREGGWGARYPDESGRCHYDPPCSGFFRADFRVSVDKDHPARQIGWACRWIGPTVEPQLPG